MALAGPPRSYENGAVALQADVGFAWCHKSPIPKCDAGASGTPNCCLIRARTPDSLWKRLLQAAALFSHQCLEGEFSELRLHRVLEVESPELQRLRQKDERL